MPVFTEDDINIGDRVQIIDDWRLAFDSNPGHARFASIKGMHGTVKWFDHVMHPDAAQVEIDDIEGVTWKENRFWCFFQNLSLVEKKVSE